MSRQLQVGRNVLWNLASEIFHKSLCEATYDGLVYGGVFCHIVSPDVHNLYNRYPIHPPHPPALARSSASLIHIYHAARDPLGLGRCAPCIAQNYKGASE